MFHIVSDGFIRNAVKTNEKTLFQPDFVKEIYFFISYTNDFLISMSHNFGIIHIY